MEKSNPFAHCKQELLVDEEPFHYYSLKELNDERVQTLPYCIRVLLESAIRNCDEFNVKSKKIFSK